MKKKYSTTSVRYEPDESPPWGLTLGLGLQLVVLNLAGIVLTPAIIIKAAGTGESYMSWAVFSAVFVSGAATILQAVRLGRLGAGYVLPMGTSGAFIAICVTALAKGGPEMLATLIIISSLFQFMLSEKPLSVPSSIDPDRLGSCHHADCRDRHAHHV